MAKRILDYRRERDYRYLVKTTRFESTKKKKERLLLSGGMVINTTPQRCLANLLIFRLLDYYKIKDRREEYIYTGSYLKGQPVKYMTKVLDMVEEDSSFRYGQSEDDFVILLPHFIAEMKEVFYKLSIIVDGILMTDHSLWSYIKGYRECEHFRKLMDEPIISEHDAPWVVDRKMKEVLDLFDNEIDIHPLSDFYRSGVKVNRGQLMMFLCWGLVPNYMDMEKMLDYPVTGGILNGYKTKQDLFLNDNISRLALITLKKEVREPGAITKNFSIALTRARLNKVDTRQTLDDCGTKRYQIIKIQDKNDLAFYRYKYYKGSNGKFDKYIDKNDDHLIGKTLKIRSAVTCDGDDIICKKCYGANAKFACDNSLFKVNVNDYTLVCVAGILQGIISIKHYLGGILMETKVTYDGVEYTLEDFIDKMDFITDIDYNIVNFVPGTQIDFTREDEDEKYPSLWIDGMKLEYGYEVTKISDYSYKFTIPNDSVKRRADNLTRAISKHKKTQFREADFDISEFVNLPVDEQLTAVLDYLRSRISLNHYIHYEIIVYSMTRDADNISARVTKDTKKIDYIQTGDITIYPDRNQSMALTLPYGRIKAALGKVYPNIQPDEYDLLYSNLLNKDDTNDSTYREMNRIIGESIVKNNEYFNMEDGILEK